MACALPDDRPAPRHRWHSASVLPVAQGQARGRTRRFSRALRAREPELRDFTSNEELGKPPRGAELVDRRLWEGVSVDTNRRVVAEKARAFNLGEFVAELRVPVDGPIRFEKTLGGTHHTLWGNPAEIRTCVVAMASAASILQGRE
jgi:hypothetical protein